MGRLWMYIASVNASEKLAPLAALQSSPPDYVHEVRFDEGADGDVWVYILAHSDPMKREKQRFICVVARDDTMLGAELSGHEAELAAWTESARSEALAFVQSGLGQLLEQRTALTNALVQQAEIATAKANLAMQLGAKVDELRATIEPLRSETKPEVRAQVALLDLELGRLIAQCDAERGAAEGHRDRVLQLDREIDAAKQAVARAEAEFESDVLARLGKRTPPHALTDRIAELQAAIGRVSIHASGSPSVLVSPSAVVELVQTHAEWMRGGAVMAAS